MKNIFLTGDKGIGKSTLLFKIVNKIDCSIGGFYEKKIVYRDEIKFDMVSLYDGRCNNIIGKINKHKLPEIYKDIFETVGVEILTNSLNYRDCIVMDEIGFFEIQAENFKNKVFEILDSSKLVIGVLKKCNNEFLNTIKNRKDVVIFDVTLSNRDYIFDEIIDYLKRLNIPLKGKRTFNIDRLKAKEYVKDLKLDINDYPKKILEFIKGIVGSFKDITILDIGSGPGTFSVPLSKLGAKLVAVDSSIYMFDALIDEVKRQNLNIKCHLSSFEYFDPPICDVAICAFAANSLKDPYQFEKLYSKVRKYIFIITQTKSKEYEFSLYKILNFLNKEVKTSKPYLNIVKMLDEKNCAFSVNFFKINFHKTFKDYDDIYKFVCERLGEKLNRSMVFDLLKDEIIKYKDELILLNTKNCSVITVIKGG